MREKIFNNTGGLFSRLTGKLELQPLTLSECRELLFAKKIVLPNEQLVEYYLALGGIPYYWNLILPNEPAGSFLQRCVFDKGAVLCNEFEALIEALFRESEAHIRVLTTLAQSRYGMARDELAKKAKLSLGGTLERSLKELCDSTFITSYVPFGYKEKGMYFRLTDEFTLFYLTWIKGIRATGISNRKEYWHKQRGTGRYYNWTGASFEIVCQQHVSKIVEALGISGIRTEVATWRTFGSREKQKIQIDLLIDRADNVITLVECKYSEHPVILTPAERKRYKEQQALFIAQTKTKKFVNSIIISIYGLQSKEEALFFKDITVEELI